MFNTLAWFLVILGVFQYSGTSGDSETQNSVLILNTVDGSFIGINIYTGKELWHIFGPPIISQSLSDLRLVTKTNEYGLVPSLDGQLYLMEKGSRNTKVNTNLRALPLSVDSLFTSHFMLTDDSILTGSKESSLFSFDPACGKIKYNCTRDGCFSSPEFDNQSALSHGPTVLVYRTNQIVRAIHIPTGSEKWNLSIRNYELCLMQDSLSSSTALRRQGAPTCGLSSSPTKINPVDTKPSESNNSGFVLKDVELDFDLNGMLVTATTKPPFSSLIWSYKLPSRIAKSWVYDAQSQTLQSFQIFSRATDASEFMENPCPDQSKKSDSNNKITDFIKRSSSKILGPLRRPANPECLSRDRLVYLGTLNGQLYVQLEDGFDWPLPTQISFPKVSGLSEPLADPHLTADFRGKIADSNEALVGYYRASYTVDPKNAMCHQPLLVDEADSGSKGGQTGLVPWHPVEQTVVDECVPATGDSYVEKSSSSEESFSTWMFDSANDLLMLLMRANEVSDRQRIVDTQSYTLSIWNKYWPLVQIGLLFLVLHLFDRFFHPSRESLIRMENGAIIPVQISSNTIVTVHSCRKCSTSEHSSNEERSPQSESPRFSRSAMSCGTQSTLEFQSIYESEFIFIRCLGRGGFGRVFEAENRFDGCRYAIKRIQIDRSKEDKNKFLREVKALASLDHPGIVRYHRAWSECPPPGWQEARDKLIFGDSDENTREPPGSSFNSTPMDSFGSGHMDCSSLFDSDNQSASVTSNGICTEIGDFASPFIKKQRNDDSLICFEPQPRDDQSTVSQADHSIVSPISGQPQDKSTSIPSCDLPHLSYLYIQMQLCSPLSLRDWLLTKNEQNLRPPRREIYAMFRQIVDAVAYLHEHALMHRDLKPSNILFDLTNRLKLADFGLVTSMFDEEWHNYELEAAEKTNGGAVMSCVQSGSLQNPSIQARSPCTTNRSVTSGGCPASQKYVRRHTNYVGTDLYMSPEQERGDPYDCKVDIFSLGLIFIELLIPFRTTMERVHSLTRAKIQCLPLSFVDDHPEETAFILRLLDNQPSNRPSATQILASPLLL